MKKKKSTVERCDRNLWSKRSRRNPHQLTKKKEKWTQRGLKKEKEAKKKKDWCESEEQREPQQEVDNDQKEEKEK